MTDAATALDNPLEDLIGYRIRRLSASLMGLLAAELQTLDLRPSDASILILIGANPRVRQSEIGRVLGIQRANMAPLISSLERRGFIRKEWVDGRSYGLLLTLHGDRTALAVRQAMQRNDGLILEALASEERPVFGKTLQKITRVVAKAGSAADR